MELSKLVEETHSLIDVHSSSLYEQMLDFTHHGSVWKTSFQLSAWVIQNVWQWSVHHAF